MYPGEQVDEGPHCCDLSCKITEREPVPHIVAAVPNPERSSSHVVHLYLAGYKPAHGGRSMPRDRAFSGETFVWQHSMCATVSVNEIHPGAGGQTPHPWKYEHKTLSEARHMVRSGYLRWCHLCIGHAVQTLGLPDVVVQLIIEKEVSHGVAT